jgi:hypothetical protein
MPPERMAEYEEPFALSPVIEIDTRKPVSIECLTDQVKALWAE